MFKKITRRYPIGPALWVGVVCITFFVASLFFLKRFAVVSGQWFGIVLLMSLLLPFFTLPQNDSPWIIVGIFMGAATIGIALAQDDLMWAIVDIFLTAFLVVWGLRKLKDFPGGWRTPLWDVLGHKE